MAATVFEPTRPISQITLGVRVVLGTVFSLVSTALLVFAFQPYSIWPLAFVAYVPAYIAQYHLFPRRLAGLGSAISVGGWLAIFLTAVFGGGKFTWIFLAVAMLVGMLGILTLPGIRSFHERTHFRWFVLQGAFDVAALEMIRSFIPMINTHAFMAQTAYSQPWLVQPVSVFSIYGLTFVIMAVNFTLALGVISAFNRRWRWDDRPEIDMLTVRRWIGITGAVVVVWVVMGVVILAGAPSDAPTVRVAAVQHGYAKAGHMDPDTQAERLQVLGDQTRIAAQQGAQFVLWPELAVGFDPQLAYTAELRALAAETNTYILIGYGIRDDPRGWRNEAVLLAPSGEFSEVYGKANATSPVEPPIVTAGTYPVFDTALGPLATIICNDVNFTSTSRRLARSGARLITVPALETGIAGWEQRPQAILRAVENHVAVVKVDAAGLALIIDPNGRIVATKNSKEPYALVADVPLGRGNTLTTSLGDWFGWLALAGMIAFTLVINRKPRLAK